MLLQTANDSMLKRTLALLSKTPKANTKHPEEYLKIAREWPHEYHAPENYKLNGTDEIYSTEILPSSTSSKPEDFSSPFFTRILLFTITSLVIYRISNFYKIPLFDSGDGYKDTKYWADVALVEANARRELNERRGQRDIHRIAFKGLFERKSDYLIVPASEVDGVVFKSDDY